MSKPTAFSYVRFSTREQSRGDSLRRQTEAAAAWCAKNGATLDGSTTLHDLGKSAYLGAHRKNPDRFALAGFLKLVEDGRVPKGSFLVIENLDRLTREHIRPALTLLLNLIEAGVRVVQLKPVEQVYDEQVEPMQLMMAIMELSRGHSESKMKSERIGGAWAQKKARLREKGELYTRRLPAWLEDKGGKPRLIPARGAAIKRIFQMAAAGHGNAGIVKRLTTEKVPAFGSSGHWTRAYVDLILKDRRVLGELQPRRPDGTPDGDVVKGYYPPAIEESEWHAAHAGPRPSNKVRRGKHANLFNGLMYHARDGGRYYCGTRNDKGKRHRVLINADATEGRAKCYSFPLPAFEEAILSQLAEIDPHEILNGDDGPDESLVLAGEMAGVEAELAKLVAFLEKEGFSPTLGKRVQALEEKKRDLAERLAQARQKALHPLSESWGECQSLLSALENAPDPQDARLRLRAALRRIVDSIWLLVVPLGRDRLCVCQVWFSGGERHRDYTICHRPPKANGKARQEGSWWCTSLVDDRVGLLGDLRRRADAGKVEKALAGADPDALEHAWEKLLSGIHGKPKKNPDVPF